MNCDIIRDLIPLYVDDVCSKESSVAVEEHVADCLPCRSILQNLKSNLVENELSEETNEIIYRHAKRQKRKSLIVGLTFAGILMIPIIVCLIVNLATGHGLDWFFIVLAGLAVFASVTVVPMTANRNRFLLSLGCFTTSLLLLFMTVCIYVGGDWFFFAAGISLFSLSLFCLPIALNLLPQNGLLKNHKALLSFAADTVLYFVMLLGIGLFVNAGNTFWGIALPVSGVCVFIAWLVFLPLRYWKTNRLIKAGTVTMPLSVVEPFVNYLINQLIGSFGLEIAPEYEAVQPFQPLVWNEHTINWNVNWIIAATGILTGIILLTVGIIKKNRKK
ncbi:MAG: zf-HC2 domain-containing protein [Eubacterium sp.]|nr:zf-HC2 domain-containing protein [Eubacterium sp.]